MDLEVFIHTVGFIKFNFALPYCYTTLSRGSTLFQDLLPNFGESCETHLDFDLVNCVIESNSRPYSQLVILNLKIF